MRDLPILGVRLAMAAVGVAFFAWSLRTGQDWARWVAIGCLAVAVLLRFVGASRPRRGPPEA